MTKNTVVVAPLPKTEQNESWIGDRDENEDAIDDDNRNDWKCIFPFHNRTR